MSATAEKTGVKRGPNPPLVQTSVRLPEETRKALKEFSAESKLFEQTVFDDALSNHVRWGREYADLAKVMGLSVPELIDELLKACADGKKAREIANEAMRNHFKKGDGQEGETQ